MLGLWGVDKVPGVVLILSILFLCCYLRLSSLLCCLLSIRKSFCVSFYYDFHSGRSPLSNTYHPPLEDGAYPSAELRKLEIEANEVFAVYRDQWGPLLTSSFVICCDFVIDITFYWLVLFSLMTSLFIVTRLETSLFFFWITWLLKFGMSYWLYLFYVLDNSFIDQIILRYYEGGISSVYMWEDETEGFIACFLIKKGRHLPLNNICFVLYWIYTVIAFGDIDGSKSAHGRRGYLQEGAWDAIHVIQVMLGLWH